MLYDVLLFGHIAAAIIWLGSGFLLHVLVWRAERADNAPALMGALRDMGALGNVLFVPASLATLAFGLGMVFVAGWSFTDLWILLGLVGYATTFTIGAFFLKPRGEAIGAIVAREGISPEAVAKGRQLAVIGRIDAVVLFLVVAVMALKPTIHDLGVLAALAAALILGVVVSLATARGPSPEAASA
jgi:uncharacterized membrane protein